MARDIHDPQFEGISAPFIRRPVGTSLLMIAVVLVGIIAYFNLPVAPLPRTDSPVISVSAQLPGAEPETMAASVAAPLERRFAEIAGVNELTSVSGNGVTVVTMQFDLNRSINAAVRDVQAAINSSTADLPSNLPAPPTWRKSNPADAPILILALTSDELSPQNLFEAGNTILAQRLSQVRGVAQVLVFGADRPAVRVQADPTRLAAMNLSLEDIRAALIASDAHGPKGRLEGAATAYTIAANDQMYTAKEYQPLILRSKNGAIVRLRDVASVTDSVVNTRVTAWFNDKRAVIVLVFKQPDANVIETVDGVKALMPQLEKWMPPSAKISVFSDRTLSIRSSVAEVQFTMLISIVLVTLIVYVFLHKLWSTFAAASAVPLSLLGTFAGMWLCGFSLDNLSLMSLTVVVGFVIDDAIVMIENVTRHAEMGKGPLQAARDGARQIGFTVVSISVSLVAVFMPLLFMGGLVGRLFHEFAVTLTIAIAVSLAVSLAGTPMLCAYLAPKTPPLAPSPNAERGNDAAPAGSSG